MHSKVKRLRERGARLSEQEILRAPFVEGEVTVVGMGGTLVAEVRDLSSQTGNSLIPALYEARLLGMHTGWEDAAEG